MSERSGEPDGYIDSHAHLAMEGLADDRGDLMARAREAGLTEILTASTSLADCPANLDLISTEGSPRVYAAVGVHPHQAKTWKPGDEEKLSAMAARPGVVAIGETGLDYHYDFSPRERQREVLARQVAMARDLEMPIIIHCREAADDTAAILEEGGADRHGGVIHCFTENEEFARRALALGFYISFSGILTFKTADDLREIARGIPEEKLLVETDAPYLTPVPHRGKTNEPAMVPLVLAELARVREKDPSEMAAAVRANFLRFIGACR